MSDLLPRVLSAIVMVALALGALWLGGRWFVAFWYLASAAIVWEWLGLIGSQRRLFSSAFGAAVLAICAGLVVNGALEFAALTAVCGIVAMGILEREGKPYWAAAGLAYAAILLLSVTSLRLSVYEPHGFNSILWLFAIVWGTDILAYFGGRLIGGPKLWPRVSPSKTWSGFLCGVTGGMIAGLIVLLVQLPASQHAWIAFILIGFLLGAISQGGDLLESSIKRHYGAKDASQLIPGHGGFMDRLDGFITACAAAAVIGLIRGGTANPATGLLLW